MSSSRRPNPGPAQRFKPIRTLEQGAFGVGTSVELFTEVAAFTERANDDRVWKQFKALSGSVAVTFNEAVLSTGTTQFAYMTLQTVQQSTYEPGKGIRMSWTARFPDGNVSGAFQAVGAYHGEAGFAVGYPNDGSGFGFMFRRARRFEVQALQVTAAATGSETVTVTLNGTAHAVPVTSGTVQQNAKEIAEFSSGYTDSGGLVPYQTYAVDDTVYFIRQTQGAPASGYTATSTGTLAATFSQFQAGAQGTQTWTRQADWNIDPCDGGGPSGVSLDPTVGNVYLLTYGWLGYLGCMLWVQDPNDQRLVPVHYEKWGGTNSATGPMIADPRFPIIYAVASLGSTTDVSVAGASCYVAQEGNPENRGPGVSVTQRKTGVGTTEVPIVSAMTNLLNFRNNTINRRAGVLRELEFANVGGKDAIVNVYIGEQSNLVGSVFQSSDDDSILLLDTSATALTGTLDLILSANVPSGGTVQPFLDPDRGRQIYRGQVLIITAQTSASTTEIVVTINGNEDI